MPTPVHADSPISPATDCFAIAPSDSAELRRVTKAIYVGTGGDIVVRPLHAPADVTFRNLPAGGMIDVCAIAVRATGTTAADLVALA